MSVPDNGDDGDDDGVLRVETDQQLQALGSHLRRRVLRVLRDGPATVTQIAAHLGITKGNANHHVKVLARAGFVEVVDTRKVRGVTELYYGPLGMAIVLPDTGPGEPNHLMRHALAEVEAAPAGAAGEMRLKFLRLGAADFDAAMTKLHAVFDEICALHDPDQPAADFFYTLFRPRDLTRGPAADPIPEPGAIS